MPEIPPSSLMRYVNESGLQACLDARHVVEAREVYVTNNAASRPGDPRNVQLLLIQGPGQPPQIRASCEPYDELMARLDATLNVKTAPLPHPEACVCPEDMAIGGLEFKVGEFVSSEVIRLATPRERQALVRPVKAAKGEPAARPASKRNEPAAVSWKG